MDGVTRESIKPILQLQRIDSGIDRLTARRANLPEQKELDELTAERAGHAEQRSERQGVLDGLISQQNKLEAEIAQLTERKTSEEKRMMEVTNPREIGNIQAELDALARRTTHLEDQELEIMEDREGVEGEVATLDTTIADLDVKIADATSRRDAANVEIDKELGELGAERTTVVPTLTEELIEFYDDLRGKYGLAVGALEEGTCKACGLPLSPVARDEIKRSDDPIIRCENCRRLLVIP